MSMFTPSIEALTSLTLRASLLLALLAAPVFALPRVDPVPANFIEAPAPESKGLGFVLTVMLQRH